MTDHSKFCQCGTNYRQGPFEEPFYKLTNLPFLVLQFSFIPAKMKKTKYRELMKFAQLIKNNFGFLWDQLITFNYLIDFAGC